MGILAFIKRKLEWVRALDTFVFRRNRPAAPARFCEFGHTVFSGNNLCNYGHHGSWAAVKARGGAAGSGAEGVVVPTCVQDGYPMVPVRDIGAGRYGWG